MPALSTAGTDGGALGTQWRIPRANDWKGGITGRKGSQRKPKDYYLPDQVNMWMTPTSALEGTKTQHDGSYKPGLKTQAALWATRRAHDAKMSPDELNRHDGLNKAAFLFGRQAPRMPVPGSVSCETTPTLPLPLEESLEFPLSSGFKASR